MRYLALFAALAACGKNPNRDSEPKAGTPTASTTTGAGTPAGTVTSDVVLTEGGGVTCAFPAARGNGYYDRRTQPHPAAAGSYTWGGGIIVGDFDGDGTHDLIAATEAGPELYLTVPGPTSADVSFAPAPAAFGGLVLDFAVGGTAADVDGDGDLDLVLTRWERPNALLINQGGTFTDGTPPSWSAKALKTQSASLADMDGDGDLDVFFGSYGETPDTFDDPTMPPADPAELYRNDGGGVWTDLSDTLPAAIHDGYTFASGWWQLWGDALPELVVANDFGKVRPTVLGLNLGGGSFSVDASFHDDWEDMGMGVADVNGDAQPDFLFSSWKSVSVLASGVGYGLPGLWIETSDDWGIAADVANRNQVYGWGAEWGDLDSDADQDAMVIYSYWSTYTEAGDPLTQVDALYLQTGLLQFEQRGGDPEWRVNDATRGRGLVFADLNDDGWLDVIKGHPESESVLYLSRCGTESWLKVRLRDHTSANTHGIGATVRLVTGPFAQTRWIHAGSSGMYGGAPPEAHFGLAGRDAVDRLEVVWPDGAISAFEGVSSRQVVTLTRGAPEVQ